MQKKEIDFLLTITICTLIIFGVIMVSSVSVYSSFTLTEKLVNKGVLSEPHNSYFLTKTIAHVIVGFFVMMVMAKIPYQKLENKTFYFYVTSVILLFIVLFMPALNGAKGWIDIKGLPSIQPVEIAKLSLILFLAYFMKKRRPVMKDFKMGFLSFFIYVGIIVFLLGLQPDFGSVLIIAPITLAMYFVGGGNKKFLMYGFIGALCLGLFVYGLGKIQQNATLAQTQNAQTSQTSSGSKPAVSLGYISQRIDNFLRSDLDISKSKNDDDAQLRQGFIALGSGGFWGLGLGSSIQKYGYLPEVQGDFIFSVIVEEFGFFGGFLLIAVYIFIAYRGYYISKSVSDLFGKYAAFGITTWFLIQAFVNIGVNLNVVPLTGVTLPFVSYGGSSMIVLCLTVGILLSISRNMEYKTQNVSDAIQARRKKIIF